MDTATLFMNGIPILSFIDTLKDLIRKKIFFTEKKLTRFVLKWGVCLFLSWVLMILSNVVQSSFLIILFATISLLMFGVIAAGVAWFLMTRIPKIRNKRKRQIKKFS